MSKTGSAGVVLAWGIWGDCVSNVGSACSRPPSNPIRRPGSSNWAGTRARHRGRFGACCHRGSGRDLFRGRCQHGRQPDHPRGAGAGSCAGGRRHAVGDHHQLHDVHHRQRGTRLESARVPRRERRPQSPVEQGRRRHRRRHQRHRDHQRGRQVGHHRGGLPQHRRGAHSVRLRGRGLGRVRNQPHDAGRQPWAAPAPGW